MAKHTSAKTRLGFTLWWYLARHFFVTIFITLAVLLTFVYLIEILELLRKFSDKDFPSSMTLWLAALKIPNMALELAPFSILMGTLFGFTKLTQTYELIAIRGAGIAAKKFILPAAAVCLGIGIFNVTVWNPLAATTLKKYERTMAELFPGSTKGLVTPGGSLWLKQDNTFLFATNVENNGRTMQRATVFTFTPDGSFKTRQDAQTMTLKGGKWDLQNVYTITPDQNITYAKNKTITTTITPEVIQSSFNSPQTLSIYQLNTFISTLKNTGFNIAEHAIYYHTLLASPALLLAMFILALPFALNFSRRHGLGSMVIIGLGFGFAFFLLGNLMTTYALTGRLPLLAAAWLPPLAAASLGIFFLLHFKEE